MKIKTKLFLILATIFLIFTLGIWHYSNVVIEKLNQHWAARLIEKQIIFDKNRTLQPIMHEVALALKMAQEPTIIAMALNDDDPNIRQAGLNTLEHYRLKFQDRSYFAAFEKSKHYYFNDYANSRAQNQLAYTLDPNFADNEWFYKTIALSEPYQINVNKDTLLGLTKVWINVQLKHQGKVIGVIGTGMALDEFLKQTVDIQQEGIRNLFVNHELAIQLDRDTNVISYASFIKPQALEQGLGRLIKNSTDLKTIREISANILSNPKIEPIQTFWGHYQGQRRLIGIAYLPELDWFSITIFDPKQLILIDPLYIFFALTGFLALTLLLFGWINKTLLLNPIATLSKAMNQVREGNLDIEVPIVGGKGGELESLSLQFKKMLAEIKQTQDTLEQQIEDRTQKLRENEQKLNTILDSVQAFVFIKDADYNYIYANKCTQQLFNKSMDEIIGKDDTHFFDENAVNIIHENDVIVIEEGKECKRDEIFLDEQGDIIQAYNTVKVPLRREDGTIYGLCGVSWDITEQKRAELEIKKLAYYDSLTGLPNRRLLHDHIQQAIAHNKRYQTFSAILFLDLDNFKPLNDTYGHDLGDQLLIQAGQRLKRAVRETDTVARFGGDEFVVLLTDIQFSEADSLEKSQLFAEKLLDTLSHRYELTLSTTQEIIEHSCSASIGVVLFSGDEVSADEVILKADLAMYGAKQAGKQRVFICKHPKRLR